jgi:hypothetical protein
VHPPGVEPGPIAWKAIILPLDQGCIFGPRCNVDISLDEVIVILDVYNVIIKFRRLLVSSKFVENMDLIEVIGGDRSHQPRRWRQSSPGQLCGSSHVTEEVQHKSYF